MSGLPIPGLEISNFLGIKELPISELKRVTLLSGDPAAGKTTILDAVRVYAARGQPTVMSEILGRRGEIIPSGGRLGGINWKGLFYGRPEASGQELTVRPAGRPPLTVRTTMLDGGATDLTGACWTQLEQDAVETVTVYWGKQLIREWPENPDVRLEPRIQNIPKQSHCLRLDAGEPDVDMMSRLWNDAALGAGEERAVEALNLVSDEGNSSRYGHLQHPRRSPGWVHYTPRCAKRSGGITRRRRP